MVDDAMVTIELGALREVIGPLTKVDLARSGRADDEDAYIEVPMKVAVKAAELLRAAEAQVILNRPPLDWFDWWFENAVGMVLDDLASRYGIVRLGEVRNPITGALAHGPEDDNELRARVRRRVVAGNTGNQRR